MESFSNVVAIITCPLFCFFNNHLWNAYENGDIVEARRLFNRLLPLLNMQSLYPLQVYKEVLKRRGVIQNAFMRNYFQTPLDVFDYRELDVILLAIKDLMIIDGKFKDQN